MGTKLVIQPLINNTNIDANEAPTIVVVNEGPRGPKGQDGGTAIGGFPVNVSNLQAGDHLEFNSTEWVNVNKTTITDGGNF